MKFPQLFSVIYDVLGIISPSHILEKVMDRELCNEKISWDAKISKGLKTKFKKWANYNSSIKTNTQIYSI